MPLLWICFFFLPVNGSINGTNKWNINVASFDIPIVNPRQVWSSVKLIDLKELTILNLPGFIGTDYSDKTVEKEENVLKFLVRHQIIANNQVCGFKHAGRMTFIKNPTGHFVWRCSATRSNPISYPNSVSLFENQNLSFREIIYLAARFVEKPGESAQDAARQTHLKTEEVQEMHKQFRLMTKNYLLRQAKKDESNNLTMIGGPNNVVELLGSVKKRQYLHNGHLVKKRWIYTFSLVSWNSQQFMLFKITNATFDNIFAQVKKRIHPGSILVSEIWSSDNNMKELQRKFDSHPGNNEVVLDRVSARSGLEEHKWEFIRNKLHLGRGVSFEKRFNENMFEFVWRRYYKEYKLLNRLIFEMKAFEQRDEPEVETVELDDNVAEQDTRPLPPPGYYLREAQPAIESTEFESPNTPTSTDDKAQSDGDEANLHESGSSSGNDNDLSNNAPSHPDSEPQSEDEDQNPPDPHSNYPNNDNVDSTEQPYEDSEPSPQNPVPETGNNYDYETTFAPGSDGLPVDWNNGHSESDSVNEKDRTSRNRTTPRPRHVLTTTKPAGSLTRRTKTTKPTTTTRAPTLTTTSPKKVKTPPTRRTPTKSTTKSPIRPAPTQRPGSVPPQGGGKKNMTTPYGKNHSRQGLPQLNSFSNQQGQGGIRNGGFSNTPPKSTGGGSVIGSGTAGNGGAKSGGSKGGGALSGGHKSSSGRKSHG